MGMFKELTWVCFKELTWVCLTYYVLMLKKQSMRYIFFIDAEKQYTFTLYFNILQKQVSYIVCLSNRSDVLYKPMIDN